jgi:hypothetical protein
MNMREKIARAALKMWHYANMTAVPEFDGLPDLEKQQWLLVADGVLDALMEPTVGMYEEGLKQYGPGAYDVSNPEDVFVSMIRAAKEGK